MADTPNNGTSVMNASETVTNPRDQFGRDAAERTVELSPEVAEAINLEVIAGKHQTYDDALTHLIRSGVRENKRTRDQQAKAKDARELAKKRDDYAKLLETVPAMATDPAFVAKMIADLVKARK